MSPDHSTVVSQENRDAWSHVFERMTVSDQVRFRQTSKLANELVLGLGSVEAKKVIYQAIADDRTGGAAIDNIAYAALCRNVKVVIIPGWLITFVAVGLIAKATVVRDYPPPIGSQMDLLRWHWLVYKPAQLKLWSQRMVLPSVALFTLGAGLQAAESTFLRRSNDLLQPWGLTCKLNPLLSGEQIEIFALPEMNPIERIG